MKKLILILAFFTTSIFIHADSPLTSTDLTIGYQGSDFVLEAKNSGGVINEKIMNFLIGKGAIGEKMAVICQLGWGKSAMQNYKTYLQFTFDKRFTESKFTADDRLCLAYLAALGNYFDVTEAKMHSSQAVKKNSKSFTFQIIHALICAQEFLDQFKWCDVYKVCDAVRTDKKLKQDMAQGSINGIFEYIDLYKEECK